MQAPAITRAVIYQAGRNLKPPRLLERPSRIIFRRMILPRTPPALTRLRVKPDEPAEGPPAINADSRPRGSRRLHADSTVALIRRLIETTTLSQRAIAAKTGISQGTISFWARNSGWQRPAFAPRATDTVPTARAGRRLKLRLLAERLQALAERMVRELEETPGVDLDKLMQALQALKMARLEAQGRCGRRKLLSRAETERDRLSRDEAIRAALKDMRRSGVDIDRAPQEAVDLVIDANLSVEDDHPALRPRGKRSK